MVVGGCWYTILYSKDPHVYVVVWALMLDSTVWQDPSQGKPGGSQVPK